jgi:hypothetical protein
MIGQLSFNSIISSFYQNIKRTNFLRKGFSFAKWLKAFWLVYILQFKSNACFMDSLKYKKAFYLKYEVKPYLLKNEVKPCVLI